MKYLAREKVSRVYLWSGSMADVGTPMGTISATTQTGSARCADGCLLRELIAGSESAFGTLYDRYSASIFATAQHA